MSLPKINVPTFEFTTGYGRKVKFRMSTMKEEKILLTAAADEGVSANTMLAAIKQVLGRCLIGTEIDDLVVSEIEELFIHVRKASVSNVLPLVYTPPGNCEVEECPESIDALCSLDDYYMKSTSGKSFEEAGFKKTKDGYVVMITDTEGLVMVEPKEFLEAEAAIYDSVTAVFSGDEYHTEFTKEELMEFFDGLHDAGMDKIKAFFDCIPTACVDVKVKCRVCGIDRTKTITGLFNFFA